MIKYIKTFSIFICLCLMLILYQNCGENFVLNIDGVNNSNNADAASVNPQVTPDITDPNDNDDGSNDTFTHPHSTKGNSSPQIFPETKQYWISVIGSDSNNCSNSGSDACRTIQKGISLAGPGDIINVLAGTYVEDSANSQYTTKCIWMNAYYASVCMRKSGTKERPITLRAAPGDEGKVTVDSQSKRSGLHLEQSDYIRITGMSFINNYIGGVSSWGRLEHAPDLNKLSRGVLVENNYFYNTTGPKGVNSSAIAMWGSVDWVVRNNSIEKVSAEGSSMIAGIQSYGVINALIEHNEISDSDMGVYWKDHYVKDSSSRGHYFESEIRYNIFKVKLYGVQIGIRGTKTAEAGHNYIHHNIISGFNNYSGYSGAGIFNGTAGAYGKSGWIRIEHNLFDGIGSNAIGMSLDSHNPATVKGNISIRTNIDFDIRGYSTSKLTHIEFFDYNLYGSTPKFSLSRYDKSNQKIITGLSDWSSMRASDHITLDINYPDKNSHSASPASIIGNLSDKYYRYATDSPALGFMPDGSNAGPYQVGNEIIGNIK